MASAVANLAIKIVGDSKQARGAIKSLDKSISGFASNAMGALGALSLGAFLMDTVKAAGLAEKAQARLSVSVQNSGHSWKAYQGRLDKAIESTHRLAAVDDEELSEAVARLVTKTGDLNGAMAQIPLLADISAAGFGDLSSAADIVAKVMNGQYGQLKRMGIIIPKTASQTEALALMQAKFGGQAAAAGKTSEAAARRAAQAYEDLQEVIGSRLAPHMADMANSAADLLDKFDRLDKPTQDLAINTGLIGAATVVALPTIRNLVQLLQMTGKAALLGKAALVGLAGAVGFGIGTLINRIPAVQKAQSAFGGLWARIFATNGVLGKLGGLAVALGTFIVSPLVGVFALAAAIGTLADDLKRAVQWFLKLIGLSKQKVTPPSYRGSPTGGHARGGIVVGPTSGYPATLHGAEAIIPLSARYRNDALALLPTVLGALSGGGSSTTYNITGDRADANAIATQVRAVLAQSISPVPAMG